jgi:hypothetical protein
MRVMPFVGLSKSKRGDEGAGFGGALSLRRGCALELPQLMFVGPMTCEASELRASPMPHGFE